MAREKSMALKNRRMSRNEEYIVPEVRLPLVTTPMSPPDWKSKQNISMGLGQLNLWLIYGCITITMIEVIK